MSEESKKSFLFSWDIKNFSYNCCGVGDSLLSPTFTALALYGTIWNLKLYPNGVDPEHDKHMACFLYRFDKTGPEKIEVHFDFSIVDREGVPQLLFNGKSAVFHENMDYGIGNTKVWNISQISERKAKYIPNNVLTIQCRITLQNKSESDQCTAQTLISLEKCSFKRQIGNISSFDCSSKKENIQLPFEENFEMILRGDDTGNDFLCILIKKTNTNCAKNFFMEGKLSVLNVKGEVYICMEDNHMFLKGSNEDWIFAQVLDLKILKEKPDQLLKNDTLHLLAEFSLSDGTSVSEIEETEKASSLKSVNDRMERLQLQSDNLNLLNCKEYCDVQLNVEATRFFAHKVILCARSPVFKTMFSSDMTESTTGVIVIEDMDVNTVENLLQYIYSGKIMDIDEQSIMQLYIAADKYQILPLKYKCSTKMRRSISTHNVCEILILADRHQDNELKVLAQEFLCDHAAEILISEEWKKFITSDINLATEIMKKLSIITKTC